MTNDTFKIKMRTNVWYVYVGLLVPYTQKIWSLDEELHQVYNIYYGHLEKSSPPPSWKFLTDIFGPIINK